MIGLCLKYEANNYGSKLQALATLRLFEELGFDCKIIQYGKVDLSFKLRALSKLFDASFIQDKREVLKRKMLYKRNPDIREQKERRLSVFAEYDKQHFERYVVRGRTYSEIQKLASQFDAVVTCSDQLWSPAGLSTQFYNLLFVPDSVKKVSFASSFGVSQIPSVQVKRTRHYLNRIEYISCRENRGAEIVEELTGRKVPVLMDPVFAYNKEAWEKIVPIQHVYDYKYVLCYFLGDNEWHRKAVESFAHEKNLKIVSIKYLDCYIPYDRNFGDISPFNVDPAKFLNILRGAEYVFTDSFHGTAFSVICHKDFGVFNRYSEGSKASKNNRIDSLCTNLCLDCKRIMAESDVDRVVNSTVSWEELEIRLSTYRKRMRNYLNQALQ